jgi:hypothetical protein
MLCLLGEIDLMSRRDRFLRITPGPEKGAAMFDPLVAKPQTKATPSSTSKLGPRRSTLLARPFDSSEVEQAPMLQRSIGNEATLRLLAQQATTLTGNELGGDHQQDAGPESKTAREAPRGVSWDFSRIPIFPPDRNEQNSAQIPLSVPSRPGSVQHKLAGGEVGDPRKYGAKSGETIQDKPLAETEAMIGRMEYPANFVGALQPGDMRAVPHDFAGTLQPGITRSKAFHATISVVTPGTKTGDCGANQYKVKWGIPASETSSTGWIVQRVNETFQATDCAGNAVTPKPVDDPAGYPFWEAWEFTAGQKVWVGPAAGGAPHSGDTFGSEDYGPGTKGKATITGEVKAIVGFTLPPGMTVRNASPAWALPYTKTEPPQFASTLGGASHTLTAEWDCCPRGTVTKATTVTTNP